MPRKDLAADVAALIETMRGLEAKGELVLSAAVKQGTPEQVLDDAIRALAAYHAQPAIAVSGANLVLADTRLLFYYQNRLAAHGLAFDAIAPKRRAAA